MDSTAFDRLSVALSRRGVIRTIAAALTGGATLAAAGSADAATTVCRNARSSCTRNSQCCGNYCERRKGVPRRDRFRCACAAGMVDCSGACVELGTNDNCNACGDACTGSDTCISGQCVEACEVLVCGDGQVCHAGACREMCVSGICGAGLTCIAAVEACVPNPCLADPSLSERDLCVTHLDGSYIANSLGGNGGQPCTTDDECIAIYIQIQTGLREQNPGMSYEVACIVRTVLHGFEIPSQDYTCLEHVY